MLVVFHCGHVSHDLPQYDDLGAHVGGGLQQDGIHPYVRVDARGLGLDHLRTAHFGAVLGDKRVQRHIL